MQPAEQEPEECAYDGSGDGDEASLYHEYAAYEGVGRSEASQCRHIVLLVYHEHRERADDVEAGYDEDEREEEVCQDFLYLHDAVGVLLLLVAVLDIVFLPGYLLHLALGR